MFSIQNDRQWELWTLSMKDRKQAHYGDARSIENIEGVFSPDGRWIAYQARQSPLAGTRQVFLQPFPATGAKYLVRDGGHPYWTVKGDALYINTGPGVSELIPVTTTPRVAFGEALRITRGLRSEPNPATDRRNADSMPDDENPIGVLAGAGSQLAAADSQIAVVLNWFDDVRQRVPRK